MKKVLLVIPTLNPPVDFPVYVNELIAQGFDSLLVVDDGSREEFQSVFIELANRKECTVLRHAVNLGKGRGIKNSLNYFLNLADREEYAGVIFVDSDGQHEVEDVLKVKQAMIQDPTKLYLGSRNFNEPQVPAKSKLGNKITSLLFWMMYGKRVGDTQTGLRGIPTQMAVEFIELSGERFQFEMNMLTAAVLKDIEIAEIGIRTVYFDNNSETHFRPIKDSFEIMSLLFVNFFKYILSSFSSFIIDIVLFQLLISLMPALDASYRIMAATLGARVGSSIFNYWINKNLVFQNNQKNPAQLVQYFMLVGVQLVASGLLVSLIYQLNGANETLIKVMVDSLLFLISYRIQRFYIFKDRVRERAKDNKFEQSL